MIGKTSKKLWTTVKNQTAGYLTVDIANNRGGVLEDVLGLEASSPRKLPCPRLEDSTTF